MALVADQTMKPLERKFLEPLDEGMVMDMPITVPRASVTESLDDLKARDMVLCRFPEVDMVVGKAGRAETPTDPAPLDMIETMVNFRPRELWPRRKLAFHDGQRQTTAALAALLANHWMDSPASTAQRELLIHDAAEAALPLFDAAMREYAYQRNQEVVRESGPSPSSIHPADPGEARLVPIWRAHVAALDGELLDRAAPVFTRIVIEQLLDRATTLDPEVGRYMERLKKLRARGMALVSRSNQASSTGHHHHAAATGDQFIIEPLPGLEGLHRRLSDQFSRRLILWKIDRRELAGFGGELDRAVQMPGWTNVWTMPIQNRVDMLATGVNTMIGIRVLGRDLGQVVQASDEIAAVVKRIQGAMDVVADPIRGKPYLEIRFDRERAARLGVSVGKANEVIEAALAGKPATFAMEGRERHPVVVRYARDFRQDEESLRELLVPARASDRGTAAPVRQVPLADVAEIQIVEGPATIKAENGLPRNYVRLNVRDRDPVDFVAEAREVVARDVKLPEGVFLEWTGQFEHQLRARQTLTIVIPIVIVLIFFILYLTYHDLADAALMLLTVPGAIAGGLFFQWLLGEALSVTVWVGYIACFGMATSTGIIMLVYLREALTRSGGLEQVTLAELRRAILDGAVHRLRPKLLTEGTVVIGLAPMLWASGVGSEIIRPMAAPVLGGILVADEVVDLLIPVLFYAIRRWRWRRWHIHLAFQKTERRPALEPPALEGDRREAPADRPREHPHQMATGATQAPAP